jgi:hypothetical protein
LETYQFLDQEEIPALVVEATHTADYLIRSGDADGIGQIARKLNEAIPSNRPRSQSARTETCIGQRTKGSNIFVRFIYRRLEATLTLYAQSVAMLVHLEVISYLERMPYTRNQEKTTL